jgi:penicillin-insensitive murein DD-endopeptidase
MRFSLVLLTFLLSMSAFSQSKSIGAPDNGSLVDADCLPEQGEGYMQLYRDMERIWGADPMIDMIQKTASDMSKRYPGKDRLQIEDISAKEGGAIEGHGSHENGLDVDIGFYKADSVEHDPIKKKQYYADPMVINGKVSPNFDVERNWELMKAFHRHGNVQKIFVDQVLKNEFCRYAKSKGDYSANIQVLRSLRHVTNHKDHMHVRLRCPKGAAQCKNLPEPPTGSGCP